MSYTITNVCPSSISTIFDYIPEDVEILNFDMTMLNHGSVFPPIPKQIKEININENIFTTKVRTGLITETMTTNELKSILKILFPNLKGVKVFVDHKVLNPPQF